jgi:hypothetical protein
MTINFKQLGIICGLIILIIILLIFLSQETFGAEPNPTGNPVGGGVGYNRIISETDTSVKFVVSTKDQLVTALNNAQPGEVVFVKGNANIDLTGTSAHVIRSGVILASDRGSGGSQGGRIFRYRTGNEGAYSQIPMLVVGGDNVRITGLRLEGGDTVQDQNLGDNVLCAVQAFERTGLEVDNCEFWGWSYSGIALENSVNSTAYAYVHHNYMHHVHAAGYGYGVAVGGGTALIEANLFDYMRHAVTGSGLLGEGYEARYNIQLSNSTDTTFDVHPYPYPATPASIAGNLYKIHHNTVYVTNQEAVGIRAIPIQGVYIDHNIFQWRDQDSPPVYQRGNYDDFSLGYGGIYMTQNLIGPNHILYVTGPINQW